MGDRIKRVWLVPGTAVLVVFLDQWTKSLVRSRLPLGVPYDPIPALKAILSLTHVQNGGAVFGLLPQFRLLYPVPAIIVMCVILFLYRRFAQYGSWVLLCLGLQLGGTAGNLIDRLLRQGYVTDFIDLNFWPMQDWAVFNVADSAVVVGVTVLAIWMLVSGEIDEDTRSSPVVTGETGEGE